MKTALITGCSSGFGLETARYFLDRDWNVVATMRRPRIDLLPASDRLKVMALDVTDAASIAAAVAAAGPIDVLVNNAGVGIFNALEGTSIDAAREVYETNVLGLIAMTQAVVPQFRERREGVIINLSSATTLTPMPLLSVYTGSKAAVNAFTTSVALELEPLGVRVRLVIPGGSPDTAFNQNAQGMTPDGVPDAYAPVASAFMTQMQASTLATHPQDVAEAIWRAATDPSAPMRLPAGADAIALSQAG
jgi:NADP-dependent 3-hydroxy acid dehydrogenase YdfG